MQPHWTLRWLTTYDHHMSVKLWPYWDSGTWLISLWNQVTLRHLHQQDTALCSRCMTAQWMSSRAEEKINHDQSVWVTQCLFFCILQPILFHSILLYDHHTPYFGSCGGPGEGQFFAVHCFCLHGVCITWTLTNHDFGLPLWSRWEPHSSGLLCTE